MKKNFSKSITPQTGNNWIKKLEKERIDIIFQLLKKDVLYKDFEVTKAPDNGQVVLKIERIIPANERGLFLLELEEKLKSAVDQGITIWCEPVGDKSKLRNLRGVEIKT
ncbi:hypothetical protein OAA50_04420 [Candidatus Pelagibacter sp.]|nr:hypothetical protein [Candidatus Pelagibacter sp.]|tara:strand:+ start:3028 stop:3354 length:327 start_codon:yes stop_codon:yes gene_type:complete